MRGETTVVVGGGCSGVLATASLVRHGIGPVTVIDPDQRVGPGVVYRTDEPAHVLNSRAGTMSVHPHDPDGFVTWCRGEGIAAGPDDFLPRGTYGRYLAATFTELAGTGAVRHVRARVAQLLPSARGGVEVVCADGSVIAARRVILALGPPAPTFPHRLDASVRDSQYYVPNPWLSGALDDIPPTTPVLLLGTGLTAIDAALSLAARGHRGPVTALSRHGLLPLPHLPTPTASTVEPDLPTGGTLGDLLRQVRTAAARCGDWRAVVDALRQQADPVWAGLSPDAQRRFLRHVSRYWEIHRHRVAPEAAAAIQRLRTAGTLRLVAGRIHALTTEGDRYRAVVNLASGGRVTWTVGAVVNCTGPGHPSGVPLVRALVADGLARADPLRLGIDVEPEGRLVRPDGTIVPDIRVLGPLRRGRLWETTAVPEIRAQADRLAAHVAECGERPEAGAAAARPLPPVAVRGVADALPCLPL
jgi:uncharacterized NAD(P)/FAD-binding protein YdhS